MTDDLEDLPGVGPATAEKLEDAGHKRYNQLGLASPDILADETGIGEDKCSDIIQAARERADIGGFQTSKQLFEKRQDVQKLSTFIPELDSILLADGEDSEFGGIETQAITELYGESGSGKSQFAHQMAVNVQVPQEHGGLGGRAIIIDTEDSYRPERIREMVAGLDDDKLEACMERDLDGEFDVEDEDDIDALREIFLERILVARAQTVNHQMLLTETADEHAEEYLNDDMPVKLLCVDSISAIFRSEYVGRGQLASRQQKLNKHVHQLKRFANLYNAAVVIPNQVQSNPDQFFGNPIKPVGGNVLAHNSNYRIMITQGKDNKRIFKLKNSPNLPEGEAAIRIETPGLKPN